MDSRSAGGRYMTARNEWAEDLIAEATKALKPYGDVSRQYVSANFQLVSASSLPDLVFTPSGGASAGSVFLVEFAAGRGKVADSSWIQYALAVRNQIVHANPNASIRTFLATPLTVSPGQQQSAAQHGLEILSPVGTGAELAASLLRAAGVHPEHKEYSMALVFVRQPPGSPYLRVGSREISIPKNLPSPAVVPILAMPFNKDVTDAWQQVSAEWVHDSVAVQRATARNPADPIYFTITLSTTHSVAVLDFYI